MRKALIHAIAECLGCDFKEQDYLKCQRRAAEHAKKTGHEVHMDLGYVMIYNPKENKS